MGVFGCRVLGLRVVVPGKPWRAVEESLGNMENDMKQGPYIPSNSIPTIFFGVPCYSFDFLFLDPSCSKLVEYCRTLPNSICWLEFRVQGLRVLGFRVLGFKASGFRGLGFSYVFMGFWIEGKGYPPDK